MYLKDLSLRNFKNYTVQRFEFSEALNVITGENGAGKTNILDAIHYLCLGKSYFHGNDLQAILHAENFYRLEGNFADEKEKMCITCVFQQGLKKELQKNGVAYTRLAEHVGLLPVVMIAPDDQSVVDGGSEERRRFLDYTLSQIDHSYLENLVSYNKVLQQRNATLRRFASENHFDNELLDSFNHQLADFGKKIFEVRKHFSATMMPLTERFYDFISGEKETITTQYHSVFHREELLAALKRSLPKDRLLQRTTEGIHRDEFDFFLNDRPLKKFGSQGQKKSFLMALKLAQFELLKRETGRIPVLLLDDLFDKLDDQRSHRLLLLIAEDGFEQVFITDTHATRIRDIAISTKKQFKIFDLHRNNAPRNTATAVSDLH